MQAMDRSKPYLDRSKPYSHHFEADMKHHSRRAGSGHPPIHPSATTSETRSPFQFLTLSRLDREILLGTSATGARQVPAWPFCSAPLPASSPRLSEKWVGLGGRGGGVLESTSSWLTP